MHPPLTGDPAGTATGIDVGASGDVLLAGRRGTGGDLAAQANAAYSCALRDLRAAGFGPEHVVAVTEHVVAGAVDQVDALSAARLVALPGARPAVSTITVHGLLDPSALLELEVTASPRPGDAAVADLPGGREDVLARAWGDVARTFSCLPLDAHGDVVAPGNLVAQTEQIYANARAALAPLGFSLVDVVKTVEFVVPRARAEYPRTGRVRRAHLGVPYGGATGIVMDRLVHPDALIQVEFFAARGSRIVVDCGWERYRRLTYNPGLRVGDTLWMSGQAALDVATEQAVLPGDVVAQAEYTYRNIRTVLEHAGVGPQALTRSVEYVTPDGLASYTEVDEVRARAFAGARPEVTTVVCSALLRPEFLIEIDPAATLRSATP